MYRVLIVDDQYFALLGLQQGVDWKGLDVTEVCLAENVDEAVESLQHQQVDLLICDIEMPGKSGLELLAWVEEHSRDTQTVMLTCHADFEYAQRAIHHGAFHYLLKPVDYAELRRVAGEALEEVSRQKEQQQFKVLMQDYQRKWKLQLPLLVERFWQDILSHRESLHSHSLHRSLETYGLRFEPEDRFVVVLLGLEQWKQHLSARDEVIMEYALRNIAGELILQGLEGVVLQHHAGHNLAILYERSAGVPIGAVLEHNCRRFIQECQRLFQCSLSTYLSPAVPLAEIVDAYAYVTGREQSNMTRSGQVFTTGHPVPGRLAEPLSGAAPLHMFTEWATMLELGELEELERRVKQWLGRETNVWTREAHDQFIHGILLVVYSVLTKKGLTLQESADLKRLADKESYPKHLAGLQAWTGECLTAAGQLLRASNSLSSAVVAKVSQYIQSRLSEEITREELAAHVYLNPAYLSRMFKKETGLSLWDAIIQERIREAKRLLEETEYKITDVAERVGYTSLGSFSNLFKRIVGVTPQQYRAKRK